MKKYFRLLVAGILSWMCWSTAMAAPSAATSSLTAILENLHTMQANFTQSITDNQGNVLQQSQGSMALQRPGKFRWNTTQPNQQLIIADGHHLWVFDKDLQQITRQPQRRVPNSPGLLLSDAPTHLAKQFHIQEMRTDNGLRSFVLTPVAHQNALFQKVILYFNAQQALAQMQLQDNLGQQTHIVFTQVTINQPLAPHLFILHAPPNIPIMTGNP